jgi:UDPglucose 6-dehydrogenase
MKICVIGPGYVGLITAVCFSKLGHDVTCVGRSKEKVDKINNKIPTLYEKDLDSYLKQSTLKATTDLKEGVKNAEVVFIAVGTPSRKDGSIDLSQINTVAEQLAEVMKNMDNYIVLVVKSTVVPGTTESLIPILEKSGKKVGKDFGLVMSPEFLREGSAIHDTMNPDRIVIGGYDDKSISTIEQLYKEFDCPIIKTDIKTAEMAKYASNSMLAVKVSFANEIGNICKKLGIDVYDVMRIVGLDHRISPKFLRAGCGFGGSCFPKDVAALVAKAREMDYEPRLLHALLSINERQPTRMVDILKSKMDIKGKNIAVLGLAFKPGTDDIRYSPAIKIIEELKKQDVNIFAWDPQAVGNMKRIFPDINYTKSGQEAVDKSEAVLLVTDWPEFNDITYGNRLVIDGKRVLKKPTSNYEGICW